MNGEVSNIIKQNFDIFYPTWLSENDPGSINERIGSPIKAARMRPREPLGMTIAGQRDRRLSSPLVRDKWGWPGVC